VTTTSKGEAMPNQTLTDEARVRARLDGALETGQLARVSRDAVRGVHVHAVYFHDTLHLVALELDGVPYVWWSDGPRRDFEPQPDLPTALRSFAAGLADHAEAAGEG
jgi:hypothetical protein